MVGLKSSILVVCLIVSLIAGSPTAPRAAQAQEGACCNEAAGNTGAGESDRDRLIASVAEYASGWLSGEPGACCKDRFCFRISRTSCLGLGGMPLGPGTECSGDDNHNGFDDACEETAPSGKQACCLPDGGCASLTIADCLMQQGIPLGAGIVCIGDDDGDGVDDACENVPLPERQACCLPDGSCASLSVVDCLMQQGIPLGAGSACVGDNDGDGIDDTCGDTPALDKRACCLPDGSCTFTMVLDCLMRKGIPLGPDSFCEGDNDGDGTDDACPAVPPLQERACCLPDGTCTLATVTDCLLQHGRPLGPCSVCVGDNNGNGIDDACEEIQTGACCDERTGKCYISTHNSCLWAWLGSGSTCQQCVPAYKPIPPSAKFFIKWSRQPVLADPMKPHVFTGWSEPSLYYGRPIVADDWLCEDDRPITDVHWWGTFYGWTEPYPPQVVPTAFHIGIWTDVAVNPGEQFSHPGKLVWENCCDNWVWNFAGYDRDPCSAEQHNDEACPPRRASFQFAQLLSQDEWFYQEPVASSLDTNPTRKIYWLSIAAVYDPCEPEPQHPWGWKTRPHSFGDDAVAILDAMNAPGVCPPDQQLSPWPPTLGAQWVAGEPIVRQCSSWDMAFELTTNEPDPSKPASADLNYDGIVDFHDLAVMAGWWLLLDR